MDPSNPYYDPNRHPSPPQNPSQHPQAYYPHIQGPYPQPAAQNPYYSGYNPQYPQQPQNPLPIVRENNLNELDRGWFQCYKVFLYIYLAISIIAMASVIIIFLQYRVGKVDFISSLLINLAPAIFIVIQLQAIQRRDLSKAKIALTGFVVYLIIFPIYVVGVSIYDLGYIPTNLAVQSALSIVGFAIGILFGSIQVYQFLKRNQRDGYQNLNDAPLFT